MKNTPYALVPSLFAFLILVATSVSFQVQAGTRKVELTQNFTPKLINGSGDLYVPIPQKGVDYQRVISQVIGGNATRVKTETVQIDDNKDNAVQVLHARWEKTDTPNFSVVQVLELTDREAPMPSTDNSAHYLKASEHVQTDGIVAETARKAVAGKKTPDEKAHAIYEWIVENTLRNPDTRGCGLGDVKTTLQAGNFKGKCGDLNSLFVGLARSVGIPAREIWGVRVAPSRWQAVLGKEGDVSKAQHCRAEYYSTAKKAWVPADAADIRKLVLDGKMKLTDPDVKRMREKLFGQSEGNWVAFNYGRDFTLPGQKTEINYFMYPQLVTGLGEKKYQPDGMDPGEVSYVFTSRVIN